MIPSFDAVQLAALSRALRRALPKHHSIDSVAEVTSATSTGGTTLNIASVPFVAGRLYLFMVSSRGSTEAATVIDDITSTTYPSGDIIQVPGLTEFSGNVWRNSMWFVDADTTVTEDVLIDFAGNQSRSAAIVFEVTGYNTSDPMGTGGATEGGSNDGDPGSSIAITFEEAGSGIIGGVVVSNADADPFTVGSGFTLGTEVTVEALSMQGQWSLSNTSPFAITWDSDGSRAFVTVAAEVRQTASVGGRIPRPTIQSRAVQRASLF